MAEWWGGRVFKIYNIDLKLAFITHPTMQCNTNLFKEGNLRLFIIKT